MARAVPDGAGRRRPRTDVVPRRRAHGREFEMLWRMVRPRSSHRNRVKKTIPFFFCDDPPLSLFLSLTIPLCGPMIFFLLSDQRDGQRVDLSCSIALRVDQVSRSSAPFSNPSLAPPRPPRVHHD